MTTEYPKKSPSFQSLKEADPEMYKLCVKEKERQRNSVELVASESYVTASVLHVSASLTHNKYSEGYPGARYYGGTEIIDEIETLCQKRALSLYELNSDIWGVNVQPYSGSIANFQVFNALLGPNGKIMGMDLFSGGHLSHGFKINDKIKPSITSRYFQSFPYKLQSDGSINYDEIEREFVKNGAQILILGASAYPGDFDYKRARDIANKNNAYLMCDMAHISGLIAYKKMNNPFEYCDIVTTTVQKMLRGPKGALIFYKKRKEGKKLELMINKSVFPGTQGGPHNQTISGIATALHLATTTEYKTYIDTILSNIQIFVDIFERNGIKMVTGGTKNHLIVVDLRNLHFDGQNYSLPGSLASCILDFVGVSLNKNSLPDDKSANEPSGIRIGTPSITCRGFDPEDVRRIAIIIVEILKYSRNFIGQKKENLVNLMIGDSYLAKIKTQIKEIASKYPIPGEDLLEKMNENC